MDLTRNIGKFLRLLEWFSEAQLLYPTISNYKEVGCLFSNFRKKQILWNYAFDLFKVDIHNMNKTRYGYFHTYNEAKSALILGEERKASKTKKSSENKESKGNSSRLTNAENNKIKESKQKKNDQQSNNNSSANKNLSAECIYCRQDGHFSI